MRALSKNTAILGIILILSLSAVMTVFGAVSTSFEEFSLSTPADSLTVPGVTFSGGPSFYIDNGGFVLLSGNYVFGTGAGGALTLSFDSAQESYSLVFAQADNPFQVEAYLGGTLVSTDQYTGTVGANEGVAAATLVFDRLVVYSAGSCTGCFAIDDLVTTGGDASEGVRPMDNRLNHGYGDATIAILYPGYDAIDVYNYATESYIFNFITTDDIPDEPPAQNTIIRQEGNIMVSILTTGEIQFNLGPDAEGKSYVFIMSDIYGSDRYGSKYDPNE